MNKVERDIEKVLETASSGQAIGALWEMLNERAFRLKWEKDQLLNEQLRLKEQLLPAQTNVDAALLRTKLLSLDIVRRAAYPDELQRLLRLMVRRIEWSPSGNCKVQLFALPTKNQQPARSLSGQAGVSYCEALRYPEESWYETLVLEVEFTPEGELKPEKATLWSLASLRQRPEKVIMVEDETPQKEVA